MNDISPDVTDQEPPPGMTWHENAYGGRAPIPKHVVLGKNVLIMGNIPKEEDRTNRRNLIKIGTNVSISNGAEIESGVELEHNIQIGEEAKIGADTFIGAECKIGKGVEIGMSCHIGAYTVINDGAIIGNRVEIEGSIKEGRTVIREGAVIPGKWLIPRGFHTRTIVNPDADGGPGHIHFVPSFR